MSRLTEHEYFMQIAIAASQRSTCPRKSVGAILVRNKLIVSTGYNGSARGLPHCIEAGCLQDGHGHCQRVVHAEINCIVNAFEKAGAWLYTTDLPYHRPSRLPERKLVMIIQEIRIALSAHPPVQSCRQCHACVKPIFTTYKLWCMAPADQCAKGLFEASLEAYLEHYQVHEETKARSGPV